jgi:plastocyanin
VDRRGGDFIPVSCFYVMELKKLPSVTFAGIKGTGLRYTKTKHAYKRRGHPQVSPAPPSLRDGLEHLVWCMEYGINHGRLMGEKTKDEILHDHSKDGVDRRGFLKCMALRRVVSVAGLAAVVMVAMALLLAGSPNVTANTQQAASATAEVKIDSFSFGPATITVASGTTVTWTNRDDIPHTVVSTDDPKSFKSKVMDTDEKFSYTFATAGTYPYFCSVHPKMTGKIVVQ